MFTVPFRPVFIAWQRHTGPHLDAIVLCWQITIVLLSRSVPFPQIVASVSLVLVLKEFDNFPVLGLGASPYDCHRMRFVVGNFCIRESIIVFKSSKYDTPSNWRTVSTQFFLIVFLVFTSCYPLPRIDHHHHHLFVQIDNHINIIIWHMAAEQDNKAQSALTVDLRTQ